MELSPMDQVQRPEIELKREKFHIQIRKDRDMKDKMFQERQKHQDIKSLMNSMEISSFMIAIERFAIQGPPATAMEKIIEEIEGRSEDETRDTLQTYMRYLLKLIAPNLPQPAALRLLELLAEVGIEGKLIIQFELIHKVALYLCKSVLEKDEDQTKSILNVVLSLLSNSIEENPDLEILANLFAEKYQCLRGYELTIFILYQLGTNPKYFPQNMQVLTDLVYNFGDLDEEMRNAAFSIISQYVKYTPDMISALLKPVMEICHEFVKNYEPKKGMRVYRMKSFDNIIILMEESYEAVVFALDSGMMSTIMKIIMCEPQNMKQAAFRILKAFFKKGEMEDLKTLMNQTEGFFDLLADEGLRSANNSIIYHSLQILESGFITFSQGERRCGTFRRMIENQSINIVDIMEDICLSNVAKISYKADSLLTRFLNDNGEYKEEEQKDVYDEGYIGHDEKEDNAEEDQCKEKWIFKRLEEVPKEI